MFKLLFCLLSLCIISFHLQAQQGKKEDVLYLKNKWVIRGKIVERSDTSTSIRTQEGNVFVFKDTEISKITEEMPWELSSEFRKGFRSFTELGPLIAGKTTVDGVTTAAFSFQTVGVYSFSPWAMPGIGAGADLYATQTILPFFATLRGDLLKGQRSVMPFYFTDMGYGVNITQQSSAGEGFKGGLLYAAGVGIKIPFNKRAGFLLSLGYRYQKTSYTEAGTSQEVIYRRLALRAGFYL